MLVPWLLAASHPSQALVRLLVSLKASRNPTLPRFCAAAAFSPSLAGRRPALKTAPRLVRSVVMSGACEDTICFYLQSAKPAKLQSLTPTELQAQIDLLQSRLESVRSGTWVQPPAVPWSDADSVSYALSLTLTVTLTR